jgi:Protein of unknown function (DUF2914)
MKATHLSIALVVALATPLAAQDTTQTPPAPVPAPAAAASAVSVEAVVARSVMDRAPVDSGTAFPPDVGQLVLWTKVSGAAGSMIRHVWFHGETEVGNVELSVASSPYRTWSRKTVPPDWTGAWHVEVRDAAGAVVQRVDFTVGQ